MSFNYVMKQKRKNNGLSTFPTMKQSSPDSGTETVGM